MTAHTRFRRIAAAATAALIAPLALVAATSASADAATPKRHKHEVTMYKVEKYIKLAGVGTNTVGDSPTQTLTCTNSSDIVLDGMWVVDHVDPYVAPPTPPTNDPDPDDNGFPTIPSTPSTPSVPHGYYDDVRDVWVNASYPDLANQGKWNFAFENKAFGDAQLKLYITCIKGSTEKTDNHAHQIVVSAAEERAFAGADPGSPSNATPSQTSDVWNKCPVSASGRQYFVAPGFKFTGGYGRLLGSAPSSNTTWNWNFAVTSWTPGTSELKVYGKCMTDRTVAASSSIQPTHQHGIAMKFLPLWGDSYLKSVPKGDPRTFNYSCDQDDSTMHGYKAMVGSFWMNAWQNNWFLGMEPQPKTRVFHFFNTASPTASVYLGIFCVNSRTSNPLS